MKRSFGFDPDIPAPLCDADDPALKPLGRALSEPDAAWARRLLAKNRAPLRVKITSAADATNAVERSGGAACMARLSEQASRELGTALTDLAGKGSPAKNIRTPIRVRPDLPFRASLPYACRPNRAELRRREHGDDSHLRGAQPFYPAGHGLIATAHPLAGSPGRSA